MKNILNRSALFLFVLAFTLLAPRGAEAYHTLGPDRVLLMNEDTNEQNPVSWQGYDNTSTANPYYWTHSSEATTRTTAYLKPGITHTFYKNNGTNPPTPLWHLQGCRAGSGAYVATGRAYISWSATAKSIVNGSQNIAVPASGAVADVGSVVMRDFEGSMVYSPYYAEGIGTVYFDAVNGFANQTNHVLVVQVATNAVEGVEFDENTAYEDCVWQTVPVDVMTMTKGRRNSRVITLLAEAQPALPLTNTLDADDLFFRARVRVFEILGEYRGAARFRICREAESFGKSEANGFILVDNIEASYPPMSVELHQLGSYDEKLKNAEVLGYVGSFNPVLLSVGQTNVFPLACYSFLEGPGEAITNGVEQFTVSDVNFYYRWRYLNQRVGEWKGPIEFSVDGTNLVARTGLELNDGVGDVEYYYTYQQDAPHFEPVDYAVGHANGYGVGWTEVLTNRIYRANYDYETPACGTDYFVRIREGESDYEWVSLVTTVSTNASNIGTNGLQFGSTEEFRMELVGDHTWRYHYYVPTNAVGETLQFHFAGKEYFKTNETDLAYCVRTNAWYSDLSAGLPYLPYTSVANSDYTLEARTKLDKASTHLLIEFNDELKSFSVSHASYQNFNMWTDAMDGFRGNASYNEATPTNGASASGVSDNKLAFEAKMGEWDTSSFHDSFWHEGFDYVEWGSEDYPYEERQVTAKTPNGWLVENGIFVPGMRGVEYDEDGNAQKSIAWQMDGFGKGTMSMDTVGKEPVPGVGEVSFTARISQIPAFDDFATYLHGGREQSYAISAQLTMSRLVSSTRCPADISPCHPSVSLVGYHRRSKGCYELRFMRVDDQYLSAELWKWTQQAGEMVATMLTSNLLNTAGTSKPGAGQPSISTFNNLLVPQAAADCNDNWTTAMFSLFTFGDGTVALDGWLARTRSTRRLDQDVDANNGIQNVIHYTDTAPGPLTYGTYGVGSCDCQAAFGQLQCHEFTSTGYGVKGGYYGVNLKGRDLTSDLAEDWDMMYDRWRQLEWDESPTWKNSGVSAVIPTDQTVELLIARKTKSGDGGWQSIGCVTNIASFSSNLVTFVVHDTDDAYVQLRTGNAAASVTVDDVDVSSWAAATQGSSSYYHSDEWFYNNAVVETTADVYGGDMEVYPAGTNGYVYVFKTAGRNITFIPKADMVVDRMLLVGGGGAGGWTLGGGGGGGGVLDYDWTTNAVTFRAGSSVNILVGKGGDNFYKGNNDSGNWKAGGNGGSTSVTFGGKKYEVKGGGGGAGWNQRTAVSGQATGGGAAQGNDNASYGSRATGTAGQGNNGGLNWGDRSGGGGGASLDEDGQGQDANASKNGAGDGGAGRASDITGDIVYYGGGGGGGAGNGSHTPDSGTGGTGGIGGGGDGLRAAATYAERTGIDGEDGLGGGGGGGSHGGANGTSAGGKGGSGVVIFRVRTAAKVCRLQPARGKIEDRTEDFEGQVEPMGVRTPFLEDGMSLISVDYANADPNCILWLQVCTNCPDASMVGGYTLQSPDQDDGSWETKAVWLFPEAAKGVVLAPSVVKTGVVTNVVPTSELRSGTLTYYQSLRAPAHGLMRVIVAPSVVRKGLDVAREDEEYGQVTITKAYCYNEPELDTRSWWGWNIHTEGWNTRDKSYAYLIDSPNGLSCMLNFSAQEADNNSKDANGIGLAEENVAEYAKNNPFVQCPPLTNGIGMVSFRARTFTNTQTRSSWVTLYGSTEPDAYQITQWDSWVTPDGKGGYKPLAEFEITNSTYQIFTWKTSDDNAPPQAIRIEVNAARLGRSPSSYDSRWEKPQTTPIQRVLIDEISVSEPVVPRLVFRDVRPFRSRQLREEAHVSVSNVTSASEQPITGESWGIQATVEPQQMSDELDMDSMRVFASFYRGDTPWGYSSWGKDARVVELPRMGSNLVFRSHMDRPESIQAPVETYSTVQYMVWAEYCDRSGVIHTNWLKSSEWDPPSWYYGLENLNTKYGADLPDRFSGYTIIDSVSPKRAWLNEVNYQNSTAGDEAEDVKNQYVEFAVPQNADLTGWYLRITGSEVYSNRVLAVFGRGTASKTLKTGTRPGVDYTNNYTFLTLKSPRSSNADLQKASDGTWDLVTDVSAHVDLGQLRPYEPYGFALVRPSGIIEHEVVAEGRNPWMGGFLETMFSGTNMTAEILAKQPGSPWFFAGVEQAVGSLGVFRGHGEDATCWTNRMALTPGELNRRADGALQDIDPEWFLRPNGTNVWITAVVDSPHIAQVIAGVTNRDVTVMVIAKGESTNIVYNVDRWYEIGALTTNAQGRAAAEVPGARGRGSARDTPPRQYTLRLDNVQESLTVNAGDQPSQVVVDAGIPRDDPYFPAIMNWLRTKFPDAEDGTIYRAEFLPVSGRDDLPESEKKYLDIKDMYWLDIPPTESGWVLRAGMGGPGSGEPGVDNPVCTPKGYVYTNWVNGVAQEIPATNVIVTVTMMISNRLQGASSAHAPQYLQGLEPGSSSVDYLAQGSSNWTSCTFKVTGALQKPGVEDKFYPLRWFVFGPDSFDENFQAKIEVTDPFLPQSVGLNYGWPAFRDIYPVFYRWRLDGNGAGTSSTELLKKDSTY